MVITSVPTDSFTSGLECSLGMFLVPKLLVVPIAIAFVAQTSCIAHPIGVFTSGSSGIPAVKTIALFTHSFGVMGKVRVSAVDNFFEFSWLLLPLLDDGSRVWCRSLLDGWNLGLFLCSRWRILPSDFLLLLAIFLVFLYENLGGFDIDFGGFHHSFIVSLLHAA